MMEQRDSLFPEEADKIYEFYFGQFRLGLLKYIKENWGIDLKDIREHDIEFGDLIFKEVTQYCHLHGDITIKKLVIENKKDFSIIEFSYKWFDEYASQEVKDNLHETLDIYVKMYNFLKECE